MQGKALIVGSSGVIGQAALAEFVAHGVPCVALSRRAPELDTNGYTHLSLDLTDASACVEAQRAGAFAGVTQVVYAALYEQPGLIAGWQAPEQMAINLQMLQNLLDPLLSEGQVQHISLLQGTKAYGAHLHRIVLPAKELSPRDDHANFYWLQEDYLKAQQQRWPGLGWTILRPQVVYGISWGSAMNLIPVLGVYGALCRDANQPFAFPGGAVPVQEAVDARLLAQVLLWARGTPAARNEVFNVTNGDVYYWPDLWPELADALQLQLGDAQPRSLARWLPEQGERWSAIAARANLRPLALTELLGESHHYADALLGYGQTQPAPPALVSTIKLRQAGFARCVDTHDMFRRLLSEAAERGIIPTLLA